MLNIIHNRCISAVQEERGPRKNKGLRRHCNTRHGNRHAPYPVIPIPLPHMSVPHSHMSAPHTMASSIVGNTSPREMLTPWWACMTSLPPHVADYLNNQRFSQHLPGVDKRKKQLCFQNPAELSAFSSSEF